MENSDTKYGRSNIRKIKRKVELLKEYIEVDNIIIMSLTETWFDNTVEDVVEIEGYNIFRGDRKEIVRGGTAIYLHDILGKKSLLYLHATH